MVFTYLAWWEWVVHITAKFYTCKKKQNFTDVTQSNSYFKWHPRSSSQMIANCNQLFQCCCCFFGFFGSFNDFKVFLLFHFFSRAQTPITGLHQVVLWRARVRMAQKLDSKTVRGELNESEGYIFFSRTAHLNSYYFFPIPWLILNTTG